MNFINIIQTTIEAASLKLLASGVVAVVFLFGELHTQGIIAVLMLILFDTILGILATRKEGSAITSRKFANVIQKSTVYFMAISAGYFTDITIGLYFVEATMVGFIGVTEFISVLENMGRMGYATPKKLLNQLKDFQSKK